LRGQASIPLVALVAASGKYRTRKELDWKLKNENKATKFGDRRPRHFGA